MDASGPGPGWPLSPISRRAFFHGLGGRLARLGLLGTAAGALGQRCDAPLPPRRSRDRNDSINPVPYANYADAGGSTDSSCGYCDATGQDYDHCDGSYCDYVNYSDTGSYSDYSDYTNYSDYSDYSNYSDYGDYSDYADHCGYCDGAGQDYEHCDGGYCDYANYGDYSDYSDSCGYCDGCGSDYEHCDGDYCDYANYADGCY